MVCLEHGKTMLIQKIFRVYLQSANPDLSGIL